MVLENLEGVDSAAVHVKLVQPHRALFAKGKNKEEKKTSTKKKGI